VHATAFGRSACATVPAHCLSPHSTAPATDLPLRHERGVQRPHEPLLSAARSRARVKRSCPARWPRIPGRLMSGCGPPSLCEWPGAPPTACLEVAQDCHLGRVLCAPRPTFSTPPLALHSTPTNPETGVRTMASADGFDRAGALRRQSNVRTAKVPVISFLASAQPRGWRRLRGLGKHGMRRSARFPTAQRGQHGCIPPSAEAQSPGISSARLDLAPPSSSRRSPSHGPSLPSHLLPVDAPWSSPPVPTGRWTCCSRQSSSLDR